MSSTFLPRLALRQSRWAIQRRAASTTEAVSQKATQAKEGAQEAVSKAQEGLSRVTSSASSAVSSASTAAGNAAAGVSERTSGVIGFVQGLIPPTMYYARVGGELAMIIFRGRNMQPPTIQNIQAYLTPATKALRNPSSLVSSAQSAAQSTAQTAANSPQTFLTRLRNMDSDTMLAAGIVTAETIGFFCIGEMIGRFKIVGYRGGHSEHH